MATPTLETIYGDTFEGTGASSVTVSGITADTADVLVVFIDMQQWMELPVTAPAGWVEIAAVGGDGAVVGMYCAVLPAGVAKASSYTFTFDASVTYPDTALLRISGSNLNYAAGTASAQAAGDGSDVLIAGLAAPPVSDALAVAASSNWGNTSYGVTEGAWSREHLFNGNYAAVYSQSPGAAVADVDTGFNDATGWASASVWVYEDSAGTTHALTASGSTTSAGAAAITAARPLSATGSATASGAAALVAARPLAADGATTTDGAAALGRTSPLSADGATTTDGAVTLTADRPLSADGAVSTAGAAAMTAARPLSASGAASTSGSAAIAIPGEGAVEHFLTASGSAVFGASGPLRVEHALTASGSTTSAGSAAITAARPLTAAGTATADGTAALTAERPLAAAGSTTTDGSATLSLGVAPLLLAASGSATTDGAAALTTARSLAASAEATTSGAATLQRAAPLTASGATTTSGSAALGRSMTLVAAGAAITSGTARLTSLLWEVLGVRALPVSRIIRARRRPSWTIEPTGPSWDIEPRRDTLA